MAPTIVDRMHDEIIGLIEFLEGQQQASFRSMVDETFRKALLLAVASFFEKRVTDEILECVRRVSNQHSLTVEFVKNKAISRQYHTFFAWDSNNANNFFGLFGEDFKKHMTKMIKEDETLTKAVKAFLELGRERNRLVHMDFGTFSLEKTSEEIFELYQSALMFIDQVTRELNNWPVSLGSTGSQGS
jgi:RiboL-PSP-HEPN